MTDEEVVSAVESRRDAFAAARRANEAEEDADMTQPLKQETRTASAATTATSTTGLVPGDGTNGGEMDKTAARATVAGFAEALDLDKQVAWYFLKVLEAMGLAAKAGKEKPPGAKVGVDVYEFVEDWRRRFSERVARFG